MVDELDGQKKAELLRIEESYQKAANAPARPVYKALIAKAMVLYWAKLTPMASAALSFSRIAERPPRPPPYQIPRQYQA